MRKRQVFLIIILLLFTRIQIRAQWERPFNQPWEVKGYYNPSFAGKSNTINLSALYGYKQVDKNHTFTLASQRVVITGDMPFQFLERKHGAGIVAYTENIGSLRKSLIAAQYSFKQSIGRGILNIGLQAGIYNLNFHPETTNISHDTLQNNNQLHSLSKKEMQVADIGAGVSWTGKRFYTGFSIMHLNQPGFNIKSNNSLQDLNANLALLSGNNSLTSDSLQSFIPRTYNFIAGYNIPLFNSLEIQPMLWILSDNNQTQMQAIIRMEYNKNISGGISMISENRYSLFVGTTIQGFNLGYAYTNQNHELYIKYNFALYKLKPKIKSHKSIRLL